MLFTSTLTAEAFDHPDVRRVFEILKTIGHEARFVGGCVRDSLLNLPLKDLDIASTCPPEEALAALEAAGLRCIPTGLAHGTITCLSGGFALEITTLRRDVACDGRHAEIEFTDDWRADASRRDFTINSIYRSIDGQLFDYFGGQRDLRDGRVAFIGDARQRIREDYLRILRYFRFFARYGKGEPDKLSLASCAHLAENLTGLSGERVQTEMLALLGGPNAAAMMTLMQQKVLHPLFGVDGLHTEALATFEHMEAEQQLPPSPLGRVAILLGPERAAHLPWLFERWKLSNRARHHLETVLAALPNIEGPERISFLRLLRTQGTDVTRDAALMTAILRGQEGVFPTYLTIIRGWKPPVFPVSGADLMERGVTPGREMGVLLSQLETVWEESRYMLTREALLAAIQPAA